MVLPALVPEMAVPPKEVFALVWIGQKKILFANGQGIVLRGRIPKVFGRDADLSPLLVPHHHHVSF
jgi:hypothetical protein